MSKRLQVMIPDDEYKHLAKVARRRKKSISELVRAGLKLIVSQAREESPEDRLASLMSFARYEGPTGDIEQILSEIEQGRDN